MSSSCSTRQLSILNIFHAIFEKKYVKFLRWKNIRSDPKVPPVPGLRSTIEWNEQKPLRWTKFFLVAVHLFRMPDIEYDELCKFVDRQLSIGDIKIILSRSSYSPSQTVCQIVYAPHLWKERVREKGWSNSILQVIHSDPRCRHEFCIGRSDVGSLRLHIHIMQILDRFCCRPGENSVEKYSNQHFYIWLLIKLCKWGLQQDQKHMEDNQYDGRNWDLSLRTVWDANWGRMCKIPSIQERGFCMAVDGSKISKK